jgi:hypothetical protein
LPPTERVELEEAEQETTETLEKGEKADTRSEAEKAADAMFANSAVADRQGPDGLQVRDNSATSGEAEDQTPRSRSIAVGSRYATAASDKTEIAREQAKEALTDKTLGKQGRDRPEEQIQGENREGAGTDQKDQTHGHEKEASNDAPAIDDDFGLGD